jgi:hypothetical protein
MNNKITYVRNDSGEWARKAVSAVDKVLTFGAEFMSLLADMFHGMMNTVIKIGLLVFLYPYIARFVVEFAKIIASAAGMPLMLP